ncbi:MAG: cyclase family protein [Spongiibacter marinus]|uniref:cyclase family protein n=1 Tax=Spongiibacter marinus TaxID=354246 RepID=UPI003C5EB179
MKRLTLLLLFAALLSHAHAERDVGISPWGATDEIGQLNTMNAEQRAAIFMRLTSQRIYDLSVDYYIGMPSWQAAGDPHYRLWMTHTPGGTVIDDPLEQGEQKNRHVSYSGSAISMYSHTGTHIDALSHFGLNGKIWNGFPAAKYLGDRGWQRGGVEKFPPIIARGVMLDIAALHQQAVLPDGYRITKDDILASLARQRLQLQPGDVVLLRTGRMQRYERAAAYMDSPPGLGLEAAKYLAEDAGVMVVGADNLSLEAFPSELDSDYVPVHTYLLAQRGVPIIELAYLEELAKDRVYEFAFIAAGLRLRGADAAPLRPIAIPLLPQSKEH